MIHSRYFQNCVPTYSAIFLLLVLGGVQMHAQKFHFGGSAAIVASQVDGDNLRGFNKLGYNAGLLSGYSFTNSNWLVVELQYASFGSAQNNEVSAMRLESEFKTLNVMFGYILRFGDTWDGTKKYRFALGPRIHSVQKSRIGRVDGQSLLDRYILSAHVGFGVILSDSFILDLSYNQGLSNILKAEWMGFDRLRPYYLSLGMVYYLNK